MVREKTQQKTIMKTINKPLIYLLFVSTDLSCTTAKKDKTVNKLTHYSVFLM